MKLSDDTIWMVWSKGGIEGGNDPVLWRKDECGAWIFRSYYENQSSEYGWVIDHIKPLEQGGTDDISNLRPLHWKNNARKADGSLKCHITAEGVYNDKPIENENLIETQIWT